MTARSSLLTSVIFQKLGLFHNQTFLRERTKATTRFSGDGAQVENLLKFTAPNLAIPSKQKYDINDFQTVYKNSISCKPLGAGAREEGNHLNTSGKQIQQIWSSDNKHHRQILFLLWNPRGESVNVHFTPEIIKYFKQKARMIHYVYTPLLFLPKWRQSANATRDHRECESVGVVDQTRAAVSNEKVRHSSGSRPPPPPKTRRSKSITSQGYTASLTGKSPSESPKPLRVSPDEKFHSELVDNFFQEYEQYLQTLGFNKIHIGSGNGRKGGRTPDSAGKSSRRRHPTGSNSRSKSKLVYLQKSLRGGMLIFEIGLSKPFFYTKLHVLEAQRLYPVVNHNQSNKNVSDNFLKECDTIKVLIHLHSFTYDYHMRTISAYIGQRQPSVLRKGFHIVSFLEDFIKYYSKGPNFARNFVHTGSLHVISQESWHMIMNCPYCILEILKESAYILLAKRTRNSLLLNGFLER